MSGKELDVCLPSTLDQSGARSCLGFSRHAIKLNPERTPHRMEELINEEHNDNSDTMRMQLGELPNLGYS